MDQGLIHLVKNIILLRARYNLTQKEMANIMQIGVYSIRKIERGDFPPQLGIHAVFCLSHYFKIPASDLFREIE